MKRIFTILAATTVVALAPAASAADFVPGYPEFTVDDPGNDFMDEISGDIGRSGLGGDLQTDRFIFTILDDGFGSGSITTNANSAGSMSDLDFVSATFNGTPLTLSNPFGNLEVISGNFLPIVSGVQNILEITYIARGNGSYGGQINFTPTVPEPATWGLMVLGFAAMGFAMRRRKQEVRVRYA